MPTLMFIPEDVGVPAMLGIAAGLLALFVGALYCKRYVEHIQAWPLLIAGIAWLSIAFLFYLSTLPDAEFAVKREVTIPVVTIVSGLGVVITALSLVWAGLEPSRTKPRRQNPLTYTGRRRRQHTD